MRARDLGGHIVNRILLVLEREPDQHVVDVLRARYNGQQPAVHALVAVPGTAVGSLMDEIDAARSGAVSSVLGDVRRTDRSAREDGEHVLHRVLVRLRRAGFAATGELVPHDPVRHAAAEAADDGIDDVVVIAGQHPLGHALHTDLPARLHRRLHRDVVVLAAYDGATPR